jgi:hypothetical protein
MVTARQLDPTYRTVLAAKTQTPFWAQRKHALLPPCPMLLVNFCIHGMSPSTQQSTGQMRRTVPSGISTLKASIPSSPFLAALQRVGS